MFNYELNGTQNNVSVLYVTNVTSNAFMQYQSAAWFDDKFLSATVATGTPSNYSFNGVSTDGDTADSNLEYCHQLEYKYHDRFYNRFIPHGLVVRIRAFHACGQGSICFKQFLNFQKMLSTSVPVGERTFFQRLVGVVGYHVCLTRIRSPVRTRYETLYFRPHGVTVSTRDFESLDPSSNLGGVYVTFLLCCVVPYLDPNRKLFVAIIHVYSSLV